ncbi:TonB-dependent receptor [Novosphingobium sp. B-7]|uniref:TonB-dependent receptor n=1 Tax=Novosphingobium sp. B-7 TaxID=1298855 RepID=UPI00041D5A7E|nr:TonB-dependent receptor [Novosphingobium sp. B-7]
MGRSTKTNRMIGAASATAPMALIVAALLPGQALGQTAPAAAGQTTPVSSQSGAVGQGDIVVTAQRRSENIQDVPITIEAFSGDSLKKLGVEAAADLGKIATNVVVSLPQGAGNQPAITIRGIGLNVNNSNNSGPNGIYVDEFYLSAPTSQAFAMFDLDRVEVLKGPQGTLYGRNTSGGAINFITAKPTNTFEGYLDARYGNFDTSQISGAVSGPLSDTLSARFAFVRNYSEGYNYNTFLNRRQNGADDESFRASLLYKPTPDLRILVVGHVSHVDRLPDNYAHLGAFEPGSVETGSPVVCSVAATYASQCVDIYNQPSDPKRYSIASSRTEHLKVTDRGVVGRIEWSPGTITVTSVTGYNYNQRFLPEDSDSSPYRELEVNWGNNSNEFTQELRVNQTKENYNWVAGVYYLHERLNQNQDYALLLDIDRFYGPGAGDGLASRQFARNTQVTDAYAAFGQGEYNLTRTLRLVLGGRFTHERRSFLFNSQVQYQSGGMDNFTPLAQVADSTSRLQNSAFSYRIGLNFKPMPGVLAYATLTTGFKGGDFNGGFLSPDPAQAAYQQRPVKPEKVTTYEVGIKTTFLDRAVTFNAALFYNDYRDMQLFALVPSPIGPLNLAANAEKARTYGADIDLTVRPVRNLTLSAQVGLLNTKLVRFLLVADPTVPDYSGNQLAFSPKLSTFLQAQYHIPIGASQAIDLQYSATYKGRQFLDATNDPYTTQQAYWTQDARVALTISQLELSAFVRNLGNTYYATAAFNSISPFGYVQPNYAPPRTYGVGAKINF